MKRTRFEQWLYRKSGLTLRCQRCRRFTLRDTCQPCRDAIDAHYNKLFQQAFPPATVVLEYIPMKWSEDNKYWLN